MGGKITDLKILDCNYLQKIIKERIKFFKDNLFSPHKIQLNH